MVRRIDEELGPFPPRHLAAIVDVSRERFVRDEDRDRAELDVPLPLDDDGRATVSAPHAYLLSYRLLELCEGDRLLELGSGTGYGAALASQIVGAGGSILTLEIDAALAAKASALLASIPNVRALHADAAGAAAFLADYNKVVCAFAVASLRASWTATLAPRAVLVAPVGGATQELVRAQKDERGVLVTTTHGAVRYVPDRSTAPH